MKAAYNGVPILEITLLTAVTEQQDLQNSLACESGDLDWLERDFMRGLVE